jgi:hypothetical protein
LTGVVSTFLAPLFWWQWWVERRSERLIQATILSVCALIQFVAISRGIENSERHFRVNCPVIAGAIYAKLIAAPVATTRSVNQQMNQITDVMAHGGDLPDWVWMADIAGLAVFLVLCWSSGSRPALLLAISCIWITLLASPGSREARSDEALLIHLSGAVRYYFAPQFFLLLALLISFGPESKLPSALKVLSGGWLGVALAMGLINFIRGPLDWPQMFLGPPWSQQVEQWRKDPTQPLAIWPSGWHFNLPPKQ